MSNWRRARDKPPQVPSSSVPSPGQTYTPQEPSQELRRELEPAPGKIEIDRVSDPTLFQLVEIHKTLHLLVYLIRNKQ